MDPPGARGAPGTPKAAFMSLSPRYPALVGLAFAAGLARTVTAQRAAADPVIAQAQGGVEGSIARLMMRRGAWTTPPSARSGNTTA